MRRCVKISASLSEACGLVKLFLGELSKPFVARDEEAKVITLALLTKEHAILVGEPGTAKSALVRRAAQLLNARFFKYLLTKFTEPSELFGPLDIKALQEGRYLRITKGKLPEAEIAFLDEIFKANSAILNSLLTLLQERVLYDGYNEIQVPLWSLFGASNEVPEEPELEALYDRFLLRHFVKPVSEDQWRDLINQVWYLEKHYDMKVRPVMSINDLYRVYELVMEINLEPIKSKLIKLYAVIEGKGIHITDRRKGKALKVIAANALLEGRNVATEEDLIVLKYVVPRDQDDLEKVNTIRAEELRTPYKYIRELTEIKANIKEIANYVASLPKVESRFIEYRLSEIYRELEITKERVMSMVIESGNKEVEKVASEVIDSINEVLTLIRKRLS